MLTASLALGLGATLLLVLGLLSDGGLVLLALSIACSLASAVLLGVGLQRRAVTAS